MSFLKKILIILILLLLGCKSMYINGDNIIENNSILFIKNDVSTSLLFTLDNKSTLVELENNDKIYTNEINKVDNLILLDNIITDIEYENRYVLDGSSIMVDGLKISKIDKLLFEFGDINFCVYDKNISINGDYSYCDYIYILNNEENVFIRLNDNMQALFYNEQIDFSNKFMEHLYTTWIDTYMISSSNITKLKIEKDDYLVTNI